MAIIRRKDDPDEFVDTDEIDDPACTSLEAGDPYDVFRRYVLPRIEASRRDEGSAEVLAAMGAGRSFSDAVLDTIESMPRSKTKKLRAWVEEARGTHIYKYVRFLDEGDRVSYGLMLTAGSPYDEAIAREHIDYHFLGDNFATNFQSFSDAFLALVNKFPKHAAFFEENPLVEIKSEKDYDAVLFEMNLESSAWEKPGLYDFRDEPPSYAGTVESYLQGATEAEAEDVLSSIDTDEIRDTCKLLLDRS
jgi:hypothetical protein